MGFVANFMRFPVVTKTKDRLACEKVTANIKVTRFHGPRCIIAFISLIV